MGASRRDGQFNVWPEATELTSGVGKAARPVDATKPRAGRSQPLRLLLLEDSEDDAQLVLIELRLAGYAVQVKHVMSREAFVEALRQGGWDVIVSDHTIPGYGGMDAVADLRASGLDIPFILVSGTIGERVAVEAMRAGAQDYVLKQDLTRLPVAIARELREKEVRASQVAMREQLMISDRMASAGMLAAGVAHEINNPLAVAVTNLEFVTKSLREAVDEVRNLTGRSPAVWGWDGWGQFDEVSCALQDATEALQRIRDIVVDVKLFSRPLDDKSGRCDLRKVCDSSARMARNEIRHRATLVKEYGEAPLIEANESRVGQVILNLIVNAAQSMPEGHASENEVRITTATDDTGWAVVTVSDTGGGIPPENLEKIFEPFFTTKPVGVGTGLGLAVCRRIVSELGGTIGIESELGRGSTFRVSFPPGNATAKPERPSLTAGRSGRRARILFVDDEAVMGAAMQRALSRYHDVVFVSRAAEAVERIARGERFDAIFSDFMMPDMSGMEMHQRLEQIDPAVAKRLVFLTGGAFTTEGRLYLDTVSNRVLMKPCASSELLGVIAELTNPA